MLRRGGGGRGRGRGRGIDTDNQYHGLLLSYCVIVVDFDIIVTIFFSFFLLFA